MGGWVSAGTGKCQAPLSYGGPCAAKAAMEDFSETAKQQFEAKCEVEWPCAEECVPDYSAACPVGWIDMGGGVCDAPLTYSHHCLKRVRMSSEDFKRNFGGMFCALALSACV